MKVIRKGCKDPGRIEAMACCPGIGKLRSAGAPAPKRPAKKEG